MICDETLLCPLVLNLGLTVVESTFLKQLPHFVTSSGKLEEAQAAGGLGPLSSLPTTFAIQIYN